MVKHRVLIVGTGSIGERQLRCFGETDRVELSLCEINGPLRTRIADRYNVKTTFADFNEAVASQPDVAVICTPAHLHIPMATTLANKGIHLLCEKPLSVSLDGVNELIRAIDRQGVTFAIAYIFRCHPLARACKEALDSGRFGKPLNLVNVAGQHFPFYRPAYRETYYTHHETGGGAIQDALTHMINLGEWLVGPIDHLTADAAHLILDGVDVEDTVHVLTRQGDLLGCYAHNQHQAPNTCSFTIACERATVRIEFHRQRWTYQESPDGDLHVQQMAATERDAHFITQANLFLDAVEGRGQVPCTLAAGLQTLRVNLAALKSVEERTWKKISDLS